MSEQEYRKRFMLEWQKENPEGRLWRINSGKAWVADSKKTLIEKIGSGLKVLLINARRFLGAPKHSPDLWGYTVKNVPAPCCGSCEHFAILDSGNTICSCDEGRIKTLNDKCREVEKHYLGCEFYNSLITEKKAIFTWIELKTKNDRVHKLQKKKIDMLNEAGGIGRIEREE